MGDDILTNAVIEYTEVSDMLNTGQWEYHTDGQNYCVKRKFK